MRLRAYATTAREALGMVEDMAALAALEFRDEISARVKYLCALAVAGLLGLIGLLFAGVMVLVIAWETQYRIHAAVALMVVPLIAACALAFVFLRRWRADAWLATTRHELREFYTWLKAKL